MSAGGNCPIANSLAANTTVTVAPSVNTTCAFAAEFVSRIKAVKVAAITNLRANNTTGNYSLYVFPLPDNGGMAYGSATNLPYGTARWIGASPNAGYTFTRWMAIGGDCPIANPWAANTSVTITPYGNTTMCTFVAIFNTTGCLPDLQVSALALPSAVYANIRANGTATTSNRGCSRAALNTTTSYYINGAIVNSIAVPPLNVNQSYVGPITFICKRRGTYNLTAVADSQNVVAESNENNNARSVPFSCIDSVPVVDKPVIQGIQAVKTPTASAKPADQITNSMADTSGNMYAKIMGILGVYIDDYRQQ